MTEKIKDFYGDYSTLRVPPEERRSTLNLFMVYMGVLAVVAAIFAGSGLAMMYDAGTMLVVAILGNIVLGIIGALTAYPGGSAGLTHTCSSGTPWEGSRNDRGIDYCRYIVRHTMVCR